MLVPTKFGGPYRIEARSMVNGTMQTIVLDDVLFGDVWICSGQSNMQFTVVMVNYIYIYILNSHWPIQTVIMATSSKRLLPMLVQDTCILCVALVCLVDEAMMIQSIFLKRTELNSMAIKCTSINFLRYDAFIL